MRRCARTVFCLRSSVRLSHSFWKIAGRRTENMRPGNVGAPTKTPCNCVLGSESELPQLFWRLGKDELMYGGWDLRTASGGDVSAEKSQRRPYRKSDTKTPLIFPARGVIIEIRAEKRLKTRKRNTEFTFRTSGFMDFSV